MPNLSLRDLLLITAMIFIIGASVHTQLRLAGLERWIENDRDIVAQALSSGAQSYYEGMIDAARMAQNCEPKVVMVGGAKYMRFQVMTDGRENGFILVELDSKDDLRRIARCQENDDSGHFWWTFGDIYDPKLKEMEFETGNHPISP